MNKAYEGSAAPMPESPINSALNSIRNEQQCTHNLIDQIEAKFAAVLSHQESKPATISGPVPVRGSASPLHGELYQVGDMCDGINNRLRMLLDRSTL